MTRLLLFFTLLFSHLGFTQVQQSKIKIEPIKFHLYEYSNEEYFHEETDSLILNPVLIDVIEMTYPEVTTPDEDLNKFINDTIQKILGVYETKSADKVSWSWDSIDEKPSVQYVTFNVNFVTSDLISLTLNLDWEACCGASGTSHNNVPLTFDLTNRKIISLKDVIVNKFQKEVYEVLVKEIEKVINDEIQLEKYREPNNIQTVLNNGIVVMKDKTIVYQNISYGGKNADHGIVFDFIKYKRLFKDEFLKRIRKG